MDFLFLRNSPIFFNWLIPKAHWKSFILKFIPFNSTLYIQWLLVLTIPWDTIFLIFSDRYLLLVVTMPPSPVVIVLSGWSENVEISECLQLPIWYLLFPALYADPKAWQESSIKINLYFFLIYKIFQHLTDFLHDTLQ